MNTEHVFREDSSMARTAMPEDKKLNSFGAAIKKYRTAAGYSQQELADTMNITRHAVYCWENNSARPDIETIRELTRLLDIPLYELFDLSSDNTDADENRVLGYFRQLNDTGRKITMSFLNQQRPPPDPGANIPMPRGNTGLSGRMILTDMQIPSSVSAVTAWNRSIRTAISSM